MLWASPECTNHSLAKSKKREKVRQLGNAVTPPAARDLIAAVAESLGHDLTALTAA